MRPRRHQFASFSSSWSDLPSRCHRPQCYHTISCTNNHLNSGPNLVNRVDSSRSVSRSVSSSSNDNRPSETLATAPFQNLVQALKSTDQTCTIIESSCGGLISSSLMSVPGSSRVYFGGTVAYNTKKSGKLLCGDEKLHERLLKTPSLATTSDVNGNADINSDRSEEANKYIQSKVNWTREAALSYCEHMQTDFAIAEGGATGPTFRPEGMKSGFAVMSIAGRKSKGGDIEILAQKVCRSSHGDRELNMRQFADEAAKLCLEAMSTTNPSTAEAQKAQNESTGDNTVEADDLFLDRSSHLRGDATTMQEFYQRQDALHVIVRGTNEVLFATPTKLALPTLQNVLKDTALVALLKTCNIDREEMLKRRTFLGRWGQLKAPVFALFLPEDGTLENDYQSCYFANTRSRAPLLTPHHNELALSATAYVNWQNTHRYCCACGSPLEYVQGGTCAKCTHQSKPHFHWPRQDPSIIVLINNPSETHALLARSPRHHPFLYTAVAGFVEAGETFESAVVREVNEEVGVTIDKGSINYVASQAWPFPRSCMIGMNARTLDGLEPIHIDPNEIVDAQWYDKETVYQAAKDADEMGAVMERQVIEERQAKGEWSGKLLVPSKGVLARTLVDQWLERD
eukprot:CAMPEP_0172302596 /NCGR_PEP_ID=MMETSP1058-20130122/4264_1 /TAXON_ID=83371 /ORGANISM="Detonula confervacea, Strain CCMP 353" /LENGTH=626 /DNA_ID=CAMNT_0013013127 /DNA_START=171 /DNA_END=2051 /DNA_ORIENTATION=+